MKNVAVLNSRDVLSEAAEIITVKQGSATEPDSKFVRRLSTKGFSPIAVFQSAKFYRILSEFDFFRFENLDRKNRTAGSWQFNVRLATAISFACVALAVTMLTGILGTMVNGFQALPLAITLVSIAYICRGFCTDTSMLGTLFSSGWFLVAALLQIAPQNAGLWVSGVTLGAYFSGVIAIFIAAQNWEAPKKWCGYLATQINSRLPMEKLLGKLFPRNYGAQGAEELKIKLHFNTDDNFEKIRQGLWMAGYRPCVASVAAGVVIDRDELRGVYAKREHEFPSAHDPILYLVSPDRSEIAVLARSGNFPDEKALLALAREL